MIMQTELTHEMRRFEHSYSNSVGRQVAFRDIPLKNFVDVSSDLLEKKVAGVFLRGAQDSAGFYANLIKVVNTTAAQQYVRIVSQRDIAVRKGKVGGAALEGSGGKVRRVLIDTTDDEKIRYALFNIDAEDVRAGNFDLIEQSILVAGQAFAKNILGDVIKQYVNKAGNLQALSTDNRFVAVMKAIAKNKADGFGCSAIVMHYDDYVDAITEETASGSMPWLMQLQNGTPLGSNFGDNYGDIDGFVGRLFNRIPVYAISNDTTLAGNILCIDAPAAAVLGFAPAGEIAIVKQLDSMKDLVQNKIQAKYDINNPDDDGSGNTNAVAKVTGA